MMRPSAEVEWIKKGMIRIKIEQKPTALIVLRLNISRE